jgi:integrase
MNRIAITRRVGALGEAIGLDGLSAHDCRHYWATRAIRKGTNPFSLLQAGGWTSMQTVQKYVAETVIANEGVAGGDD